MHKFLEKSGNFNGQKYVARSFLVNIVRVVDPVTLADPFGQI